MSRPEVRVRDGDGIHATQRIDLFEVVYLAHLRKKRLAHLLHCGVIDIGKTVPEDVALRCPDQEAPLANAKDRLGLDSVDVRFVRVLLANGVLELAACLSLAERRPCLACGGDGLPRILVHALGCDGRVPHVQLTLQIWHSSSPSAAFAPCCVPHWLQRRSSLSSCNRARL